MGAGVDHRIDLFVERTLARMVVDDDQRRLIEDEIRHHLDDAIAEGESCGLSSEDAEHEAILLFGQPSVMASHFRPAAGLSWYIFERTVSVLLIGIVLLRVMPTDPDLGEAAQNIIERIVFIICAILVMGEEIWTRVQVNEGLVIKRFFRRKQKIGFEEIRAVEFRKMHLFGARSIKIRHSGGDLNLKTSSPGMRAGGLALAILVPSTMDERVKDYLKSIRLKTKQEGRNFKVAFTVFWLGVGFSYLLALRPLLLGEGYPWPTLIGGGLAIVGILVQGALYPDRSKKGLSWLLAIVMWFTFLAGGAAFVLGSLFWLKATSSLLAIAILLPILMIGWRGGRLKLAGAVFGALFIGSVVALVVAPPSYKFDTRSLVRYSDGSRLNFQFAWFRRSTGAAWFRYYRLGTGPQNVATPLIFDDSEPADTFLTMTFSDQDPVEYALPGRNWSFFPSRSEEELTLARNIYGAAEDESPPKLYTFDVVGGWEEIRPLPDYSIPYVSLYLADSPWSPDGRYLVLFLSSNEERSESLFHRIVFDTSNGGIIDLVDPSDVSRTRWLSGSLIELTQVRWQPDVRPDEDPNARATITITEFDIVSKERELIREVTLMPGEEPAKYFRRDHLLTQLRSDDPNRNKPGKITLLNLETGDRIPLPDATVYGASLAVSFDKDGQRFAYSTLSSNGRGGPRLVLAVTGQGVIEEKVFRCTDEIYGVRLSSAANSIFYIRKSNSPFYVGSGIPQPEFWNYETGDTFRTQFLGLLGGELALIGASGIDTPFSLLRWSPDGNKFVSFSIGFRQGAVHHQIALTNVD